MISGLGEGLFEWHLFNSACLKAWWSGLGLGNRPAPPPEIEAPELDIALLECLY